MMQAGEIQKTINNKTLSFSYFREESNNETFHREFKSKQNKNWVTKNSPISIGFTFFCVLKTEKVVKKETRYTV